MCVFVCVYTAGDHTFTNPPTPTIKVQGIIQAEGTVSIQPARWDNYRYTAVYLLERCPLMRSTPTKSTHMRSTPTQSTLMRSTPTQSTLMTSTPTKSTPMRSTPTKSTHMRSTHTKSTPTWSTPTRSTSHEREPLEICFRMVHNTIGRCEMPSQNTAIKWESRLVTAVGRI